MDKIIKRSNGDQFKISVCAWYDYSRIIHNDLIYKTSIMCRQKGKRKWLDLPDTISNREFRNLTMKEREIHIWENMFRFVSQGEIMEAQTEFWETLKPKYPLF